MDTLSLFSLLSSIASLILAIVAIWLSVTFFKMSNEASQKTTEASKGIDASVIRLENLFDKLYSDTFSIMKDTVTDMRNHIWKKPDENAQQLDIEVKGELEQLLKETNIENNTQQKIILEKIETIFKEQLNRVEIKKKESTFEKVHHVLEEYGPLSVSQLAKKLDIAAEDLAIDHLFSLRSIGEITWDGPDNSLKDDSIIQLQ